MACCILFVAYFNNQQNLSTGDNDVPKDLKTEFLFGFNKVEEGSRGEAQPGGVLHTFR